MSPTCGTLFERQASTDQPPSLVSISAICSRGRARLRWRRAGVVGSPLLAVGVVLGLALGGAVPSARPGAPQAPGGSARPAGPMAYVLTISGTVVPVSMATGRLGRPIHAVRGTERPLGRRNRDRSGRPDRLRQRLWQESAGWLRGSRSDAHRHRDASGRPADPAAERRGIAGPIEITPDGRTAYVLDIPPGLAPVNLVTRTALRPIRISNALGLGRNGDRARRQDGLCLDGDTVVPIRTATGSALRPIRLGAGYRAMNITITPDGRIAYITSYGSAEVIPVDLATNTVLKPIVLRDLPGGGAFGIAITPDGRTGYVVSEGSAVIPVDLATGTPLRPIRLPGRQNLVHFRHVSGRQDAVPGRIRHAHRDPGEHRH